jgi:hypothetical protein
MLRARVAFCRVVRSVSVARTGKLNRSLPWLEMTHYKEFHIMRLMKFLPIVILCLASSMAMAKNDDKNKYDGVNCGKLDNDKARKECRERKYGSNDGKKVDCSKLDNDKRRSECREEKWN